MHKISLPNTSSENYFVTLIRFVIFQDKKGDALCKQKRSFQRHYLPGVGYSTVPYAKAMKNTKTS